MSATLPCSSALTHERLELDPGQAAGGAPIADAVDVVDHPGAADDVHVGPLGERPRHRLEPAGVHHVVVVEVHHRVALDLVEGDVARRASSRPGRCAGAGCGGRRTRRARRRSRRCCRRRRRSAPSSRTPAPPPTRSLAAGRSARLYVGMITVMSRSSGWSSSSIQRIVVSICDRRTRWRVRASSCASASARSRSSSLRWSSRRPSRAVTSPTAAATADTEELTCSA